MTSGKGCRRQRGYHAGGAFVIDENKVRLPNREANRIPATRARSTHEMQPTGHASPCPTDSLVPPRNGSGSIEQQQLSSWPGR